MNAAAAIFLSGVAMASAGQIFLKAGAVRGRHRSLMTSFFHPFTIIGYLLMVGSTVTSTIALKVLPLHLTASLLPLGYVVVVLLSVTILREKMKWHHLWGMLLILGGIVIFNLGGA